MLEQVFGPRMDWLTADVDTASSRAAALKLRSRATATKTWSCISGGPFIAERPLSILK
jgi:hypothetical protein